MSLLVGAQFELLTINIPRGGPLRTPEGDFL